MAKSGRPREAGRAVRRSAQHGERGAPDRDRAIWAPPLGISLAGNPAEDGLRLFEDAMALLQRHDYAAALAQFQRLLDRFPDERALLDRARVYAALCRRELARTADHVPQTTEERLTAATAALNNGDDQQAAHLVAQVLEDIPGHDLGHYLLAVVHVRRGATVAALDALRHAIRANPEIRVQARHDADFAPLRGQGAFERLVADAAAHSDTRRGS